MWFFFFFQAEDGIRDLTVTGVQTCALPISRCLAASLVVSGLRRNALVRDGPWDRLGGPHSRRAGHSAAGLAPGGDRRGRRPGTDARQDHPGTRCPPARAEVHRRGSDERSRSPIPLPAGWV